ncbi:DNA alkylation repair protein [Lacihabitans sp. CCS-44]|uniref:DNA alkylation repair protein n=1 Tax=Lacihabitans sp. CCS-44 TaxID=2487331 RepID=UPI0020CE18AD|nr:DNA alkylation repair protein [Lacihabitans sp. CCS-44]MCP9754741.1 DNA alkylation repair protein [Lacihabitans sp. CCS-44]
MYQSVKNDLLFLSNPEKAISKAKYFKNGKGEYAEGDVFIGLTNPEVHQVCKHYRDLVNLHDIEMLLKDEIHEVRFTALTLLVLKYKKLKKLDEKADFVNLYLRNISYINNWDLVDCSSMYILGPYYFETKDNSVLENLAKTGHLWSERIAIISTHYYIRQGDFALTFKLAEMLLNHKHDLIHKAVGWMLREVWSKGGSQEVEGFLEKHIKVIPRTALRYTIEKMEEHERKYFLSLK